MRYRKLTPDGDYSFGQSQQDFWRDVPEAPAQAVFSRLLLWLGEWFLDIEQGTPYMQGVLGKNKKESADLTFQQRILGTQGVTDIENFVSTLDPITRNLVIEEIRVNTIYGITAVEIANFKDY